MRSNLIVAAAVIGLTLACSISSDAQQKVQPIVIGAPLSTQYLYGWDAQRAMLLAVEEINAKGGVQVGNVRRPFRLEVLDTRDLEPGVPLSEALLVVEKLILERKADVLMGGPVRSEAALAAMDLISRHRKVSILTTGSLTPAYHRRIADNYGKYKYLFRITSEAGQLAKEAVDLFESLKADHGFDQIFVMVQDVAHARAIGEIVSKSLSAKGWKVSGLEVYPTGALDYSTGLLKARDQKAQILFVWMDHPEIAVLVKQWKDLNVPLLPVAGISSAVEQPGGWANTGGAVAYWIASPANAGNAPSNATPLTMKFYEAYTKRWLVEPEGYGTSSSYTAVYVLADAIRRAGSLDSDRLVAALEKTDMIGVYGRIAFDPKTHQVIPSYNPKEGAVGTWFQWQDGKRVVIWPSTIAVGKIRIPPNLSPPK
ncbi:MAG TPA: ABC transporter substrate-binding protein [Candidatus Eisenbacteria bacterium]|nr:ABC transporter substrate-binding protein [Candidatus Eisenbacteria bacterium]